MAAFWTRSRLLGAPPALVCTATLASCALLPQPTPDPALLAIYQGTQDSLGADPVAATYHDQGEEIAQEILRLCGHRKDGSVPASCDLHAQHSIDTDTTAAATDQILNVVGELPQDSLAVVVEQFTELSALGAPLPYLDDPRLDLPLADPGVLDTALEHEYEMVSAANVLTAHAVDPSAARSQAAEHLARIDVLSSLGGNTPLNPAPAYSPTPEFSALDSEAGLAQLREHDAQFWQHAATQAVDPQWRFLCFVMSGRAVKT